MNLENIMDDDKPKKSILLNVIIKRCLADARNFTILVFYEVNRHGKILRNLVVLCDLMNWNKLE